jgi:hypothetical protein
MPGRVSYLRIYSHGQIARLISYEFGGGRMRACALNKKVLFFKGRTKPRLIAEFVSPL